MNHVLCVFALVLHFLLANASGDWIWVANLTSPVPADGDLLRFDFLPGQNILSGQTIRISSGEIEDITAVTWTASVDLQTQGRASILGVSPQLANAYEVGAKIWLSEAAHIEAQNSSVTTTTTETASTVTATRTTNTDTTTSSYIAIARFPAPVMSGAMVIHMDTFRSFQVNDRIFISGGGNSEYRTIVGEVDLDELGSAVGIDVELEFSYPAGSTVTPANPTPPPTPAPPTSAPTAPSALDVISAAGQALVADLFASNLSEVTLTSGGITTTVYKIELPNSSDPDATVEVGGVSFPADVFAGLGPVAAAVSSLSEEVVGNLTAASSDGAPLEIKSVLSIDIVAGNGSGKVDVHGLLKPIIFPMPGSNTSSGLECQYLDEVTNEWKKDGVSAVGFDEFGNVLCATYHLSFFGAMLAGFLSTLECSQASLLAEDSYVELLNTPWYDSIGAILLFSLLGILTVIMATSCYLDHKANSNGYWKDEYFLIPNFPEPTDDHEAEVEGGGLSGCVDGCKSGLEDLMDEFLGSLCDFLGDARSMCAELCSAISCSGKGSISNRLVASMMKQSVNRSVAAAYFISMDDMDLLLSEEMDELMDEGEGEGGEPPEAGGGDAAAADGTVEGATGSGDAAAADGTVEGATGSGGNPGEEKGMTVIDVGTHIKTGAASSGEAGAGERDETRAPETDGVNEAPCQMTMDGEGEAEEEEPPQSTIFSMRNSSDAALARFEAINKMRTDLADLDKAHTASHHSMCSMICRTIQAWAVHGPIGCVFAHSILCPMSTRALLLCMDLLGAAMLTTVFTSATGGSLSKKSDKSCSATCAQQGLSEEECIGAKIGSLAAVGLASAILAGIPLSVLGGLHDRSFVRVPYEGSKEYHKQLRIWRIKDFLLWTIGTAYSLFAAHFVMLFFANVAPKDQVNWMISAAIGYFQDFVMVPLGLSIVIFFFAFSLLLYLGCSLRLHPKKMVSHGRLETLEGVLKTATSKQEVREAMLDEEGPTRWMVRKATSTNLSLEWQR